MGDTVIGESFVLDPKWGGVLVCMQVEVLEWFFSRSGRQYLGPGAEAGPGRRVGVEDFLKSGAELLAPFAAFSLPPAEDAVGFRFMNGRHRFCVLRDAGAEWVNVGVQRSWASVLVDAGLARV